IRAMPGSWFRPAHAKRWNCPATGWAASKRSPATFPPGTDTRRGADAGAPAISRIRAEGNPDDALQQLAPGRRSRPAARALRRAPLRPAAHRFLRGTYRKLYGRGRSAASLPLGDCRVLSAVAAWRGSLDRG